MRFATLLPNAWCRAISRFPDSGPYQRKEPQELLTVLDDLLDDQRESDLAVIHGAPTLDNMWLVPDGPALLTGWASAGAGDRHRDLAVGVSVAH